jgi:voltage-gated potassium channel
LAGFLFLNNLKTHVHLLNIKSYAASAVFQDVMEGSLNKFFKERRLSKMLANLCDHYIVCGAGQTGKSVVTELQRAKVPYVVIEKDPEKWSLCRKEKFLFSMAMLLMMKCWKKCK